MLDTRVLSIGGHLIGMPITERVRQKDLTNAYISGSFVEQLAANDFRDILPGDYIIGPTTGKKCWIAHRNPWYNAEIIGFKGIPHVLLWYADALGSGPMNDTNTTAGGYVGSKGKKTVDSFVEQYFVADFGDHIKTMNILLTNSINNTTSWLSRDGRSGISNSQVWTQVKGVLPNDINICGSIIWSSSGFDTGNQDFQLEIIKEMGRDAVIGGHFIQLRDVGNYAGFDCATNYSNIALNNASSSAEFRPLAVFAA